MKTLAQSLTVTVTIYSFLFLLLFSFSAVGSEKNSDTVASGAMQEEFYFEEEAYVDDIPFNTEAIAENVHFERAMNETWDMEEEAYVDDIPFNTSKIAAGCLVEYASVK